MGATIDSSDSLEVAKLRQQRPPVPATSPVATTAGAQDPRSAFNTLNKTVESMRDTQNSAPSIKTVDDGNGGYQKFDSSGKLIESLEKKDYVKIDGQRGPNYFPNDDSMKSNEFAKSIGKVSILTQYNDKGRPTYEKLSDSIGQKLQETNSKYDKDTAERTEKIYKNSFIDNSLQRIQVNTFNKKLKEGSNKLLTPEGKLLSESSEKHTTDKEGNNILSRSTRNYDKEGKLMSEDATKLNVTNNYSLIDHKTTAFHPDGRKSLEIMNSKNGHYVKTFDDKGQPLMLIDQATNKKQMYSKDGSLGLPKDTDGLKKEIDSAERYKYFESLVKDGDLKVSDDVMANMVNHGYKLFSAEDKNFGGRKEQMEKKYGVNIHVGSPKSNTHFSVKPPSVTQLEKDLKELDKEMEKYPSGVFNNAGLKNIYIHSDITSNNKKGALDRATGFFDPSNPDSLNIDSAKSFDHELYHMLDHRFNKSTANDKSFMDTAGNYRGNKGYDWYDDPSKSKPVEPIGFGRSYGMTKVNEDQATVAEQLLRSDDPNGSSARDLDRRAKTDSTLAKKRQIIISEYDKWSNGKLDKKYFDDIAKGHIIDKDYWKERNKPNF